MNLLEIEKASERATETMALLMDKDDIKHLLLILSSCLMAYSATNERFCRADKEWDTESEEQLLQDRYLAYFEKMEFIGQLCADAVAVMKLKGHSFDTILSKELVDVGINPDTVAGYLMQITSAVSTTTN